MAVKYRNRCLILGTVETILKISVRGGIVLTMQEDLKKSDGNSEKPIDVYGRSVKGGVWLVALRGFMALLSVIRIPILFRLLVPYDFGLVHIGALMTGMVGSFTNFGLNSALVQRKDCTNTHLNVVWTVGLLRGVILFGILFLVAPYVAIFFDGKGKFADNHLLDPNGLVVTLRDSADPLSQYLTEGFSDSTRKLLEEYDSSQSVSGSLKSALVDELNKVVEGPLIYDRDRFGQVELSGYVLGLVQQSADIGDNVRINRCLLDVAFDGVIKRDIIDRTTAAHVIQVLAVLLLLGSIRNIGTVYFTRDLEFHKRVILEMAGQLVSTIVAIVLAFIYRNVWALVLGKLAGALCNCTLSYVMHPYRPRLSLNKSGIKDLWGFSKHLFGISILKYFCINGDDLFLSKMLGMTVLGYYQKAFQIGNMVATEIGNKVSTVSFPAYSKLQDNVKKIRSGYFKAVQSTSLIIYPAAGGLIALAPEITEIVCGARWLPMVTAMQILCILGPLKCMQRQPVFMAMGRPDILTKITVARFLLMAASIYPLTVKWGMEGTSLCVLGTALIMQPVGLYELQKLIDAKAKDVLRILSYPFGATAVMMLCLYLVKNAMQSVGVVSLVLLIAMGVTVYSVIIIAVSKISSDYDALALIRDIVKGLKS